MGLGLLDVLSQIGLGAAAIPATFFLSVIAVWLGLNNAGRALVARRRQYVRERRAGLDPAAYLLAEGAALGLIGVAQIVVLLVTFYVGGWLLLEENAWNDVAGDKIVAAPVLGATLLACHACGLALGLLASTLSRTSAAAVAALPLLVLPQLLLSAVGNGTQQDVFSRSGSPEPYRPLAAKLTAEGWLSPLESGLDLLSLGVYTRPAAALSIEAAALRGRRWMSVLDAAHLLVLLLGTCTLLLQAFRRGEERWLRLEGLE